MSSIELLYTLIVVGFMVGVICWIWPIEEMDQDCPVDHRGAEEQRACQQKARCVDEEGFEDHFGPSSQKSKTMIFWIKCDKCKELFLKKNLEYQESIDEYFCKNCAALARIYMDPIPAGQGAGEKGEENKK